MHLLKRLHSHIEQRVSTGITINLSQQVNHHLDLLAFIATSLATGLTAHIYYVRYENKRITIST